MRPEARRAPCADRRKRRQSLAESFVKNSSRKAAQRQAAGITGWLLNGKMDVRSCPRLLLTDIHDAVRGRLGQQPEEILRTRIRIQSSVHRQRTAWRAGSRNQGQGAASHQRCCPPVAAACAFRLAPRSSCPPRSGGAAAAAQRSARRRRRRRRRQLRRRRLPAAASGGKTPLRGRC